MFDPGLNFDDLEWIREQWDGKMLVKGIVNPADARTVIELGADGVVVSSHGGRQLDRVVNTLRARSHPCGLGPDAEIVYDSGIMSGTDIAIALALGANFVLIGRAYLYGLMAGGREGVDRIIELLTSELETACTLLGVSSVRDLKREHVITPWGVGVGAGSHTATLLGAVRRVMCSQSPAQLWKICLDASRPTWVKVGMSMYMTHF